MKTFKKFYQKIDLRSKEGMIDFLSNHFRYDTMNSWNQATSYANKVKVWDVIPNELQNKVFELMDTDTFYIDLFAHRSIYKTIVFANCGYCQKMN